MHRHRTQEEIGKGERPFDSRRCGDHRGNLTGDHGLDLAKGVDISIEHHDVGSNPAREPSRFSSQRSCTEDHHGRRGNPGGTTDQQPLAAELVEQQIGANGHREPSSDLAHRLEDRCLTVILLDDLVADRGHSALQQFYETLA